MRFRVLPLCALLATFGSGLAKGALAQALPKGVTALPVQGDSGISASWRLLDDSAFSVARDYAEPGATRRMHNHPEFSYHVFILLSGTLRLTVEGEEPRDVHAGEVLRIKAGANHTFTNIGTVVATIVEVFGKPHTPAK
ncbi:MAG TPA: cupin domain-containing protein [Gemmatimonadaceae bacterium]|jgi:quercetin dioxygenase-like cupin family protein|nr:cupin domain-containing protein [Gemmatimonadaceae bacterium]